MFDSLLRFMIKIDANPRSGEPNGEVGPGTGVDDGEGLFPDRGWMVF
jgi:hypothetical protein